MNEMWAVFIKKGFRGPQTRSAELKASHFTKSETETQNLKQLGCQTAKQLSTGPGTRSEVLSRAQGWTPVSK